MVPPSSGESNPHVVRLVLDELALEHVHRADEIGHELRIGEFVDFRGRARLDDFAVIHHADAARQGHRLFLIVRHDDEGHAQLVLQTDQFELRVFAQFLVERAQRFVQQQQLRALHQRACQRHALALATGELMGLALGKLAHFHQVEHGGDALFDLVPGQAVLFEAEGDVLLDAHVREQRVRLKHHVHRTLVRRYAGHVLAVDENPPRAGRFKSAQHAQQAWSCRSPTRPAGKRSPADRFSRRRR